MATRMEAQPFIEGLVREPVEQKPFPLYRGGGYILAISGIGKVSAAVATAMLAAKYDIRQIINLGAAGALSAGRNVVKSSIYQASMSMTGHPCWVKT
jgi:nucleoside phosphorylase